MGRHETRDGATYHPLVPEALHRRPQGGPRGVQEAEPLPGREGPIGWPGPDPDRRGEPVGWPGGQPDEQRPADRRPAERRAAARVRRDAAARRGWRWLLDRPTAA